MKTVKTKNVNELIIKNSKFITIVSPLTDEENANNMIGEIKAKYKNATHYCYAYIIGNKRKSNDDGEPSGTAGLPMLNVLEKNNLANIICIVVRYFGGIKLGTGGLIRAYRKCTIENLKSCNLIDINNGYKVTFTFDYDKIKSIESIIKKLPIIEKNFKEIVLYTIFLKEDELNIIERLKLLDINIINIEKHCL